MCGKDYTQNPSKCTCDTDRSLKSIIGDSVFTCDGIIDVVGKLYNKPTNFEGN